MIGANSFLGTVNLGAKEIPRQACYRIVIVCTSSLMPSIKLGFLSKSGKEQALSRRSKMMDLVRNMGTGCFKDRPEKGHKLEVEPVRGGEDVWDAASADANSYPEHLVIMVNGLIGSAEDWRYAAEQFVKKLPDKVIVHRSESNSSRLTFDGVDLMGERLAEEAWGEKISFVAHSLGGLVARYAIGRLYQTFPENQSSGLTRNCSTKGHSNGSVESLGLPCAGLIAGLEPMNFITFATPHLGSRGHKQLPFLCGLAFLEKRASQTAHLVAGRTGRHLFLTDNDDGRPPLLLRMVADSDELKFVSGLHSFKCRVAYANANYDHIVGWRTSSIRRQHELPMSNLLVKHEKYPHVVYVERDATDVMTNRLPSQVMEAVDMEEEMIQGLTQVAWERVDVSFQKSRQRYVAHNTIQVKSYWLNSDGADVVLHMIDNFLL